MAHKTGDIFILVSLLLKSEALSDYNITLSTNEGLVCFTRITGATEFKFAAVCWGRGMKHNNGCFGINHPCITRGA